MSLDDDPKRLRYPPAGDVGPALGGHSTRPQEGPYQDCPEAFLMVTRAQAFGVRGHSPQPHELLEMSKDEMNSTYMDLLIWLPRSSPRSRTDVGCGSLGGTPGTCIRTNILIRAALK